MENPYRVLVLHILPVVTLGCQPKHSTGCMEVEPDATSCPAARDVDKSKLSHSCGSKILKITGEGELVPWSDYPGGYGDTSTGETTALGCCYPIRETKSNCDYGRPYMLGDAQVTARPSRGAGREWMASIRSPDLRGLDERDKATLACAWTNRALDEHAAVAAFARVGLQLMGAGAPADLIADTHAAGVDEVRHARLGFALASAYAGEDVGPERFPVGAKLSLDCDLTAVAVAAAQEGCIGETLSAALLGHIAEQTEEPTVKAIVRSIANDENRHAQLAWRTVRWAIASGGMDVRAAVAAVFEAAARQGVAAPARVGDDDTLRLRRHGVIGVDESLAVLQRGLREVVLPCGRLLVGRRVRAQGLVGAVAQC